MSERRKFRTTGRTDDQILAHPTDLDLLRRIVTGEIVNSPGLRSDLRRLMRDDLILVGFAPGSKPTVMPRGQRLAHGSS